MYTDDSQRPGGNTGRPQQYNDSASNYSPSTSYKYTNNKSFSNGPQQQPFNRNERFKRDPQGSNDRLVRQNDIIIRLLKDIRDRLPAPPISDVVPVESSSQNGDGSDQGDLQNPEKVMDDSAKDDA